MGSCETGKCIVMKWAGTVMKGEEAESYLGRREGGNWFLFGQPLAN